MDVASFAGVASVIIALGAAIIALLQLRHANRSAQASRVAEMSWQVYREYADTRIRAARGAAELIANAVSGPQSAEEYGRLYSEQPEAADDETIESQMRRLLRYYNQVGILLDKGLVDEDLVYATIGPGLLTAWKAVSFAADWDRIYNPVGGSGDPVKPRAIHTYLGTLHDGYVNWLETQRATSR